MLLAAVIGGLVLYVWSVIVWMVLPHHKPDFRPLGDAEDGVAKALSGTEPGWYVMPHMDNFESMKDPAMDARYREGPNASVIVIPSGPCMQPMVFVRSLLLNMAQALGAAMLLFALNPEYSATLVDKILVLGGVSVFIQAMPPLMQWNWWKFPTRGTLTTVFDGLVGMILLAIALHFVLAP